MRQAIVKKRMFFPNEVFGTGALQDPRDARDLKYDEIALGAAPVDWEKGYDIEKELKFKLPIKNQNGSSSCVGQAWSYYSGIVNLVEVGSYKEISAKAYYSQIHLPGGGAYLRDGGKLTVDWGAVQELAVPSYENGKPPSEAFMLDKSWKTGDADRLAETLKAKEYRTLSACESMELFAQAIRDNWGVVGGLYGTNNGTWSSNEPKPPLPNTDKWGHALFFGKFGVDKLGKFISTPNSWGVRGNDSLHTDGWQKFREDYFASGHMFNPWTLTDKPNLSAPLSPEALKVIKQGEKKFIIEAEGAGRKGIMVNGKVKMVKNDREPAGAIYVQSNNGQGLFITKKLFDELPKDGEF